MVEITETCGSVVVVCGGDKVYWDSRKAEYTGRVISVINRPGSVASCRICVVLGERRDEDFCVVILMESAVFSSTLHSLL